MLPNKEHLTVQIGNLFCRCDYYIGNRRIRSHRQLVPADGECEFAGIAERILAQDIIGVRQSDAVLPRAVRSQRIAGSGRAAVLHKAGDGIVLCHLVCNYQVGIIHAVQIEGRSPYRGSAVQRWRDRIV